MKKIKVTIVTTKITTSMTFADFEQAFNYSKKMLDACKYTSNNGTPDHGVAYFEDVDE